MAHQNHGQPDQLDPCDEARFTMQVNGNQQRQHRTDEFDWNAPRHDINGLDQTSENTGRTSKRRRVALACSVCRARKSRCDGMRPKCSLCIELGFECRYLQSAAYSNVIIGKEYLSLIEDRLKLVENRVTTLETNGDSPSVDRAAVPVTLSNNGSPDSGQLETASLRDDSLENGESAEDSIDGMGAVTFAPEEDCAAFGPSSNIAFLGNVTRAVARLSHASQPWRPSPAAHNSAGFTGSFFNISRPSSPLPVGRGANPEKINIYALPPDAVSRDLLGRYFSNTGLLFPYIHERSFMATFEQASKDNFKGVKRTWLALLNIIFAHAVVHELDSSTTPRHDGTSAGRRTKESEIYYRRASGLCSQQIANGTGISIDVVQFLLLMGQYLQSTQRSVQTWATHGLAVRAAFQLGLHSSDLVKVFPPLEQEIWKKTWFGCVILDRTLSMTFGRPPAIPESYVQLELPVPYVTLQQPWQVPVGEKEDSLSVSFFNGTITLYRILYMIIDLLYGNNIACSFNSNAVDTVTHVYKIESQLSEWQQRLPPELKLISTADLEPDRLPPEEDAAAQQWEDLRLRFILTLRYTNIRILLHRPVLVKFLDGLDSPHDNQDASLLLQVGTNSIQIAILSAKEIICLMHPVVRSAGLSRKRELLGAWWFSLYYTFNAAVVLVSCILIHIDQNASGNHSRVPLADSTQDMILHLRMAIEVLRDLDSDNRMVARCRDYLEQLVQVVQTLAIGQGLLAQTAEWRARHLPHPSFDGVNGSGSSGFLPGAAGGPLNGTSNNKHSPLGMELGEFMLDGDLDFLSSHMLEYNPGAGDIM